jgi:hypothetical protein
MRIVRPVGGWNPWRGLRDRDHVRFRLDQLPDETGGGIYARREDGRAAIIIDRRLTQIQRRAALAHELVHDERGGGVPDQGMPEMWGAVVDREEARVNDEVARRLVPRPELIEFVMGMLDIGLSVGAADVAEQFEVPGEVGENALHQLRASGWQYEPPDF